MGSVLDSPGNAAKGFLNSSALLEEVLGSDTYLQPNIPRQFRCSWFMNIVDVHGCLWDKETDALSVCEYIRPKALSFWTNILLCQRLKAAPCTLHFLFLIFPALLVFAHRFVRARTTPHSVSVQV